MVNRTRKHRPAVERFFAMAEIRDGCWNWNGYLDKQGYGRFKHVTPGNPMAAHRFAYQLLHGAIPPGLTVDHLCFNTQCVRPDHMEAVTDAVNRQRAASVSNINALKTRCVRGHEFDETNTLTSSGVRYCRQCQRIRRERLLSA